MYNYSKKKIGSIINYFMVMEQECTRELVCILGCS